MSDYKIGFGVPNLGVIKTKTVLSLMRTLKNASFKYEVYFKEGSILHWNRESIAIDARKDGCTHLMFIDTDMEFDSDAVQRLLVREKDVIGIHYNHRKLPIATTLHVRNNFDLDGDEVLIECDSVGTGFMLINMKVFDMISHPWFFWEANEDGTVKTGEDYWFCEKVRKAGFGVWADLSIQVHHIGDFAY